MRTVLQVSGIVFTLLIGYLLFWPVAIDPLVWHPPNAPPLQGVYQPNHLLSTTDRIALPDGIGPEDVAIDSAGFIYGGIHDGRIMRFFHDGRFRDVFAVTGGRPLGLHFDHRQHLVVADAARGLLSINPDGEVRLLTDQAGGMPFRFTDDVDIAGDGRIYFSDASHKFSQPQYRLDALEHRPNGRLLVYDPENRRTTVLLDSLFFANGVALSSDELFVLVNETWEYRVVRYWLRGAKKGQSDIFMENLPGFPDGISADENGLFWLALVTPRKAIIDRLAPWPFLRRVIARLPDSWQPDAARYGFVLGVDEKGKVIHNLQAPDGIPYSRITSVQAAGGMLYFGSLYEKAIGRFRQP